MDEEAKEIVTRRLTDAEARELRAGSEHYTAFVGPPGQYDLMGATQFMLLVTLGLRDHHRVLDFGCGSLRAGRLLIPYLQRGNYHGLEPNSWLIDDAIDKQLGRDQIALKLPHFHYFTDFAADRCGLDFDFILAQSIFSHTGAEIIERAFRGFQRALSRDGVCLATFMHPDPPELSEFFGAGWVYPECVGHAPSTILSLAAGASLSARALPWFHPRQTWYVLSRQPARLPLPEQDQYLKGAILNVPVWEGSL